MSKLAQLNEKLKTFDVMLDNKIAEVGEKITEAGKQLSGTTVNIRRSIVVDDREGEMKKKLPFLREGYRNKTAKDGKANLDESAPVGSFEYIRQELNEALDDANLFQGKYCYISYVYPEYVIVSCNDDYYQIPYSMDINAAVTFGVPVEVEQYFAPASDADVSEGARSKHKKTILNVNVNLDAELKECKIERTKQAQTIDYVYDDFHSLKETSYDPATGDLEVVIIEAGTNEAKMRHYPVSTIQEAAGAFKGMKMYINHQTTQQEKERPERDLRDWASTIVESWSDGGKAMGRVSIHDAWLRESMKDPVFRGNIGLSINAGGKVSYGKINGKEMQIVEKIIPARSNGPASVDWVTEAGARGRVSRLLKESQSKKDTSMNLNEATFEDLQRENPALVKQLKESVIKEINESAENKKKDAELKEKDERLKKFELKEKSDAQGAKIDAWLKENSKLPEIAKNRIKKSLMATIVDSEEKLKESFTESVTEELAYLNSLTGKGKIKLSENHTAKGANGTSSMKDAEDRLSGRMGIVEKKEGEDQE